MNGFRFRFRRASLPSRWLVGGALFALCLSLLVACTVAPPPAAAPSSAAPAQAVALPPSPSAVPPTPVPTATVTPASPTPRPTRAPPTATPEGPLRVGLQVGHWKIEDHPDEQARLRKFSGAYYGGYDEWEINIVIAELVQEQLEAAGVLVDLLPATVPVGYQADAFISLHADGVTGPQARTRRGWKVATPFRASQASEALAAALSQTYPAATGLPDDPQGASYDMRAYYAFASYRYWHSIAPTTPAVIIECGFMTHPSDRELLFNNPQAIAKGIANGVLRYLAAYDRADTAAREPVGPGMLRPVAQGVQLRDSANATSATQKALAINQRLVPVAEAEGWYLVFTHGGTWDLGWVRQNELQTTGEPLLPPHPKE